MEYDDLGLWITSTVSGLNSYHAPQLIDYSTSTIHELPQQINIMAKHSTFLKLCEEYAKLSKSNRLKVGCLIVCSDVIVSSGYNKMPPNYEEACEKNNISYPEVIHAEINAISNINMVFTYERPTLYCTHAPCLNCAKNISISPVSTIYFSKIWENHIDGIKLLVNVGKTVKQIHVPTNRS